MKRNVIVFCQKKYKVDESLVYEVINYLENALSFKISELQVNFVSPSKIIQINKKYLNHHFSTDIITFDYSNNKKKLDSELYISVEDARFNSKRFGVTFEHEIVRLVIHGVLHLLGYDDKTAVKKKKMKRLEDKLLFDFVNKITL